MAAHRLMRRFRAGDPEAVRSLYEDFGKAVHTVAMRALGDRGLAEEAVQLTFLHAWKAADSFDTSRDPAPWLYAIARRVAIDLYRRERRHSSVNGDEPEMAVLPPSIETAWEAWEVRIALEQLAPDEREVVRAIHYRGLTQREAAEEIGVPVGTIKSRSHRAHKRLAVLLGHLRQEASA